MTARRDTRRPRRSPRPTAGERRKRSDGEQRREQIISAAAHLFSERGIAETGIDEIGERAGITGPGVYRHFTNKEDLLWAVLERALRDSIESIADVAGTARTPKEALERLIDHRVRVVLENRALAGALWKSLRHLDSQGPSWFDRIHRLHVDEFVHALVQLRPGLSDAEARARVEAFYGLVLSAAERDAELDNRRLSELLAEMSLRALLC